jgi:hypothetical protein
MSHPLQLTFDSSPDHPCSFGALLQHLRETHPQADLDATAHDPHDQRTAERPLSDAALCAALATHGCPLDVPTYLAIESGDAFPEDAVLLLDAVSQALQLTAAEVEALVAHFAYDLLRRELGEELARELVVPAPLAEGAEWV